MLLKLFKYDFKASARFGIPVMIGIAAAAILGCINAFLQVNLSADSTPSPAPESVRSMLLFSSMGGLLLITFILAAAMSVMAVLLLVQFYRSTVSDEAYLTFTLPVTPGQILWAKLLNTLLWSLITAVVLFLAAAAMISTAAVTAGVLPDILRTFGEIFDVIDYLFGDSVWTVVLALVTGIASVVSSYLMLFMAITFGSVIARKHKAMSAVAMIFGISFVMNGIRSAMQFIILGNFTLGMAVNEGLSSLNVFLVSNIVLHAALAAVYFFVTRYMMEYKLNLD